MERLSEYDIASAEASLQRVCNAVDSEWGDGSAYEAESALAALVDEIRSLRAGESAWRERLLNLAADNLRRVNLLRRIAEVGDTGVPTLGDGRWCSYCGALVDTETVVHEPRCVWPEIEREVKSAESPEGADARRAEATMPRTWRKFDLPVHCSLELACHMIKGGDVDTFQACDSCIATASSAWPASRQSD